MEFEQRLETIEKRIETLRREQQGDKDRAVKGALAKFAALETRVDELTSQVSRLEQQLTEALQEIITYEQT